MNVIATKREGVESMYLACTVASAFITVLGMAMLVVTTVLLGVVMGITCGYLYFECKKIPNVVISIDENNVLHLPKGVTVSIDDVIDVSYRRASAKSIQYKWGSVALKTKNGMIHKYGYIAECEEVAKRLTDMMYQAKYERE